MNKKWIWHILLILYIVFVFSNSLTPYDRSSANSSFVLALVQQMLGAVHIGTSWLTEHMIRKLAHFGEYTVMGILLYQSMKNLECGIVIRRQLHTAAFFFIPFADETLQLFVEGRSGQLSDVWLDMSGVLAGTVLAFAIAKLISKGSRKKRKRSYHEFGKAKYKNHSAI